MAWVHFQCLGLCISLWCALAIAAHADSMEDTDLRAQLQTLSRRRVFFGHQSVGMNLLEGVRELAALYPDIPLRVVEVTGSADLQPGTFAHAFLPENGNPALKLESFERALSSGIGSAADIALIKFCYADFSPVTDVSALFARYQTTLSALRARHPHVLFVHVTAPLTTVADSAASNLKRLFGRAPGGLLENAKREEFDQLLRRAYGGREPLFDLARLESTSPDGRRELQDWNGSQVPALLPAYSDDGGHLNSASRVRFARELIALLASLPPTP